MLFLVTAGRLTPDFLPEMPAEIALTPFERLVDRRVHQSNVMGALILMAIREAHSRDTTPARRAMLRARLEAQMEPYVTGDGSVFGWPWHTLTCLLGLAAVGATADDSIVSGALRWLSSRRRLVDGRMTLAALGNDTWSTALALEALADGGPRVESSVARAVEFLVARQSDAPMPLANQRKPGAPRTGGWAFQGGSEAFADTHHTAMVVAALSGGRRRRGGESVEGAVRRGVSWLLGMQNPSGGFPTFVWDLPEKASGPLFVDAIPFAFDGPVAAMKSLFDPPPELGDPSAEGVTGRALWALGRAGMTRRDRPIGRAISFLQQQQCEHGGWWGRWMGCYLVETANILMGLAAVGEDTNAPYVERALDFLVAHQNADGGWGETGEAYARPELAGHGPSMAPVTAFVLLGLLAVVDPPFEVVHAGIAYLLRTLRSDGGWDNGGFLHAFLPPDALYEYNFPALAVPVMALARYRRRREAEGPLTTSTRRRRRSATRLKAASRA